MNNSYKMKCLSPFEWNLPILWSWHTERMFVTGIAQMRLFAMEERWTYTNKFASILIDVMEDTTYCRKYFFSFKIFRIHLIQYWKEYIENVHFQRCWYGNDFNNSMYKVKRSFFKNDFITHWQYFLHFKVHRVL